jgi:hypothetical protein
MSLAHSQQYFRKRSGFFKYVPIKAIIPREQVQRVRTHMVCVCVRACVRGRVFVMLEELFVPELQRRKRLRRTTSKHRYEMCAGVNMRI